MRIPAWERENFRLNKGNIFPSRKSLVSDIPAGEGKTAKLFFTVHVPSHVHLACRIKYHFIYPLTLINNGRYIVTVVETQ